MKHLRSRHGSIPIHVSTIAGILNEKDLNKYLDINPACIIPHHDVNRNFSDLTGLINKTSALGIKIELMLTESCLRRCPFRANHYTKTGSNNDDLEFHLACNTTKIARPAEILKANFIRPEDMSIYEDLGVNHFKVTGR